MFALVLSNIWKRFADLKRLVNEKFVQEGMKNGFASKRLVFIVISKRCSGSSMIFDDFSRVTDCLRW